jgi:hypothetical protein
MGLSVVEGGNLPVLGVSFVHWGYFIIKRLRSTRGVLREKVFFDFKAAKGAGRGWQKYLWVSPTERPGKTAKQIVR